MQDIMGLKSYVNKRQKEADAMSDEEFQGRMKIAKYLAIFIVVAGLIYFPLKIFVLDKDDDGEGGGGLDPFGPDSDFIIRDCNIIEVVSDTPCGLRVKTPQGKYCCLP